MVGNNMLLVELLAQNFKRIARTKLLIISKTAGKQQICPVVCPGR
jgi:hypothetical protein